MLKKGSFYERLKGLTTNPLQPMYTIAEVRLNPKRYHLSEEAKKHLRWMYLLYEEHNGVVSEAGRKIGISRQWLSRLKNVFERHGRDPRSLEPYSRAPLNRKKRKRISEEYERLIIKERDASPNWGAAKIQQILFRDHFVSVGSSTVNRYLHKHNLICLKISEKNKQAWKRKKSREQSKKIILKVKYRPPRILKDYAPGALMEKDMKFIPKQGISRIKDKERLKENFAYQHTIIDSFTRMRVLEIVDSSDSATATKAYQEAMQRFPFPVACFNTDNGSENEKEFSKELQRTNMFHFYSSAGTPTDNPRVERSHKTDDDEWYQKKGIRKILSDPKKEISEWERIYNTARPHQALGYLTPMEFFKLWKRDPNAAHSIAKKWRAYLSKQRERLLNARRMKRKEQIEALMKFIDVKLSSKKVELEEAKFNLVNCQLCSWT